jgi:hypothetical protein
VRTALADSEAQPFFDGDGGDELDIHLSRCRPACTISTPSGRLNYAGHVGGAEVELGPIVVEERECDVRLRSFDRT